jgi:hypothetical protein
VLGQLSQRRDAGRGIAVAQGLFSAALSGQLRTRSF